jgi:hypothetical protein
MATKWQMKGEYLKTCNCAPGCPCDFWAPPTHYFCEGFNAMRVKKGNFGKTSLDGTVWAVLYHWPGPLHLGNGTIQAFIHEKTTPEQREALLTILSGKAGCPWFEIVASLVSNVLPPKFVPIDFKFDLKKRKGRCGVKGEVEVDTAPISDAMGNQVKARVVLPEGVEYFSAEVAAAKVLRSTGAIAFDHSQTHSTFSEVTYTPKGLKK